MRFVRLGGCVVAIILLTLFITVYFVRAPTVWGIAFNPVRSNELLVFGSDVRLIDLQTNRTVASWAGRETGKYQLHTIVGAFSQDGSTIALGRPDGVIRIFSRGHPHDETRVDFNGPLVGVQFVEESIVALNFKGVCRQWNAKELKRYHETMLDSRPCSQLCEVGAAALTFNGTVGLIWNGDETELRFHWIATDESVYGIGKPTPSSISVQDDGTVWVGCIDGSVLRLHWQDAGVSIGERLSWKWLGTQERIDQLSLRMVGTFPSVDFPLIAASPGGERVCLVSRTIRQGVIGILRNGAYEWSQFAPGIARSVTWTPDGEAFAILKKDSGIELYDKSGAMLKTLQ